MARPVRSPRCNQAQLDIQVVSRRVPKRLRQRWNMGRTCILYRVNHFSNPLEGDIISCCKIDRMLRPTSVNVTVREITDEAIHSHSLSIIQKPAFAGYS